MSLSCWCGMDPSQRARSTLATLLTKPPILGRTPSGAVLYDLAPQKQQLQEDKLLKQQQKMQRHTDNWFPGRLASTDSNDINYEILQWKEREIISSSPLENLDSVVINLFVPTSTEAFEAEFYSNSTETFVRQAIVGAVGCECGLRVRGTKRGVAFSNNLRGDYDVVFINSNDSMIKDLQAVLRHLREDVADIAGSTQPNSVEKDRNRDGNGVFAGTQADAFLLTNLSFGDSDAATPTLQSPASLVTTAPVVQYPRFSLGEMLPGTGYSSSVAFLTSRSSSFMTDAIDENSDRNRHVSVGGNKDAEYGSGYGDGRSDGLDPVEESVLMHDQLFQLERKAEELKKAIAWSSIRHRDEAASAKGSYLMSYSDVEKIRAVFNIFDSNSLGVITSKEIKVYICEVR